MKPHTLMVNVLMRDVKTLVADFEAVGESFSYRHVKSALVLIKELAASVCILERNLDAAALELEQLKAENLKNEQNGNAATFNEAMRVLGTPIA